MADKQIGNDENSSKKLLLSGADQTALTVKSAPVQSPAKSLPSISASPTNSAPSEGNAALASLSKSSKAPINSRFKGIIALYSLASAISAGGFHLLNQSDLPKVDDNGNAKTGLTAEQMENNKQSYGKLSLEEKKKLFAQKISKGTPSAQSQTPEAQRMDQYASSFSQSADNASVQKYPPWKWAIAGGLMTLLASWQVKKRTGRSLAERVNGPRSLGEASYNAGVAYQEKRDNVSGAFDKAQARQKRSDNEVPNEWLPDIKRIVSGEDRVNGTPVPDTKQPPLSVDTNGTAVYPSKTVYAAKPGKTRNSISGP